ncbi:alpha/beta fold hydrolase [Rhodococcus sp. MEB041]|uniref:alpha/beta hydrolase n=1 Tax=Rhodococcus sp. MEB041 TaxID=3040323 RepID=UPI00254E2DF6|nr:alpha/beta fold hydrolase [Rhodococcus sp. MEB041]
MTTPIELRIDFEVDGLSCEGILTLPDNTGGPFPVAVGASGFGGVKEMLLPSFSRALASEGIAGFIWDFPNFGASQGEPRQHVDPPQQARSYRAALTAMENHPAVDGDRMGVWGPSLAGSHALATAADDPRVRAVVAIIPFIRLRPSIEPRIILAVVRHLLTRPFGRPQQMIPAAGEPGVLAAMTTDGAQEWVENLASEAPLFRNEVTVGSLWNMARWSVAKKVRGIRVPLRVIVAEADSITPASMVRKAVRAIPDVDIITYPDTHFEVLDEHADAVRRSVTEWMTTHL